MTLIELMVALLIGAILVVAGVPTMMEFVQNNRMTAQTNAFLGALGLARTEAVRRGGTVAICPSSDGTGCSGSSWEIGWMIFADSDGNGAFGSDETLLKVQEKLTGDSTLRAEDAVFSGYLLFRANGYAAGNGTFTQKSFYLCDSRGASKGRTIAVSATGRVSSATPAGACP